MKNNKNWLSVLLFYVLVCAMVVGSFATFFIGQHALACVFFFVTGIVVWLPISEARLKATIEDKISKEKREWEINEFYSKIKFDRWMENPIIERHPAAISR